MLTLPPPTMDALQVYDAIAAAKYGARGPVLTGIRTAISFAYQEYTAQAPHFPALTPHQFSDEQKNALLHAYTVPTEPLTNLRTELLQDYATRCPFCAIGEPCELDHYLPKASYPQYSVLPANLVPSCGRCNNLKNDSEVQGDLLHPYYDSLPDAQFLVLSTELKGQAFVLRYSIATPPGHEAVAARMTVHFNTLKLKERYRMMSLDYISSRRGAFRNWSTTGGPKVLSIELEREGDSYAEAHGTNHWRAVLHRALARDEWFCEGGYEIAAPSPPSRRATADTKQLSSPSGTIATP